MTILYEVTGYCESCPSEKFSEGLYKTREKAEQAKTRAREVYDCEFEIDEKYLKD
jgi:hypothetical protein